MQKRQLRWGLLIGSNDSNIVNALACKVLDLLNKPWDVAGAADWSVRSWYAHKHNLHHQSQGVRGVWQWRPKSIQASKPTREGASRQPYNTELLLYSAHEPAQICSLGHPFAPRKYREGTAMLKQHYVHISTWKCSMCIAWLICRAMHDLSLDSKTSIASRLTKCSGFAATAPYECQAV